MTNNGNHNLTYSRKTKSDEFYTLMSTVEAELKHYQQYFADKTIYCNCDNPKYSNFWRYFKQNFVKLKLHQLIATYYDSSSPSYKWIYDRQTIKKYCLLGNGDFHSAECLNILKQADLIVTNEPFSLFSEYLMQLMQYHKRFLIIGNQNAITYKQIMPLIKESKIWLGYTHGHFWFKVPNYYENKKTDFKIDEQGQKLRRLGNICWFTNLPVQATNKTLLLNKIYLADEYPKYTNCDAIEVGRTSNIPKNYKGLMGVPISFIQYYNPKQFKLLGIDRDFTLIKDGQEKTLYARLVIRHI